MTEREKAPRDVASYLISKEGLRNMLKTETFTDNEIDTIFNVINEHDTYLRRNFKWM